MQICSDPLRRVRSVRPDEQWCVKVPAGYPTLFPYRPSNVEHHGEEMPGVDPVNIDNNKFGRTTIKIPSMCANNQLIQRLQQGIEQYQISSGNNPHQGYLRSFGSVKQDASNGNRRERINRNHIQQNELPTSGSAPINARSTSLSHHDADQTRTHQNVSLPGSPHRSHLSNGPIYSTGSQSHTSTTSDRSSQFSGTPSTVSSLTESKDYSDQTPSNSTRSSSPTNDTDESSVMSIPVPLSFSKAHAAKKQMPSDQLHQSEHNAISSPSQYSGRQLNDDYLLSATKMTRSPSLSPSDDEQEMDSRSSSGSSISSVLSSNSNISNSTQQDLSTTSFASSAKSEQDDQFQSSPTASHQKIGNKFSGSTRENSSKYSHPISLHNVSSDHLPHTQTNERKRLKDRDQVHMTDAMTTLAFDLTEVARQALINKRNDSRQSRLIRLLTAPYRCCRTCRTQRRLVSIAQRSINIAMNT